jgi:hypothetical protein
MGKVLTMGHGLLLSVSSIMNNRMLMAPNY